MAAIRDHVRNKEKYLQSRRDDGSEEAEAEKQWGDELNRLLDILHEKYRDFRDHLGDAATKT